MNKRTALIITALIVAGFLLRLWLLVVMDSHSTDGIGYLSTAEYMRDPSGWTEIPKRITMPFYPFLAFLLSFVTNGNIVTAGRWASMLVGLALIPLVFLLARKLFDEKIAIIASFLTAIDWVFIVHSTWDRADLLFTLMTVVLAYSFWKIPWEKTVICHALLFGLLMGLTQLTRTNGVLYFSIFIPLWIVYAVRQKIKWTSFLLRTFLPALIVYSLLASLPILYLDAIHAPSQSYLGHTFLDGILSAQGDREQQAYKLNDDATDYVMTEQIRKFKTIDIWNLRGTLVSKYVYGWKFIASYFAESVWKYFRFSLVVIIPLLIMFFMKRKEIIGWDRAGFLLLFFLPFALLLPIMHLQESFFVPLWPFFLIILSWFIIRISDLKLLKKSGPIIGLLVLIAVVAINLQHLAQIRNIESAYPNAYRLAGEYIHQIAKPGDTIMARDNTAFFYANLRGYRPPSEPLDRVMKYLKHMGIDYFILGPVERKERPELTKELIDLVESGDKSFEIIRVETRGPSPIYILKYNGGDDA